MTTFDIDATYGGDPQAALTAATAAGGGTVRGRSTYAIAAPLVVGSGTTLDLTGATVTAASHAYRMIKNVTAQTGETGVAWTSGPRDHDIALVGGTWIASGATAEVHRLVFNRIDGLSITGVEIITSAGKYAIEISDATNFIVGNVWLNVTSDGVHITGPASQGLIYGISGATLDDFVALGCSNWPVCDISRGDITDVVIQHLNPHMVGSDGSGVRLWVIGDTSYTDRLNMRRISVRDVRGTVGFSGVNIGAATVGGDAGDGPESGYCAISDITLDDIGIVSCQPSRAVVLVHGFVPITNLVIHAPHIGAGSPQLTAGLKVSNSTACQNSTVEMNELTTASSNRVIGLLCEGGSIVGTALVHNADLTLPTADSALVSTTAGVGAATINALDTTGSVTRRTLAEMPAGYLTGTGKVGSPAGDGNRDVYLSADGSTLTTAGYAYVGQRIRNSKCPPSTGLAGSF